MGRPSKADELGLSMVTAEIHRGNWQVTIADDDGVTVFEKDGYLSEHGAKTGASRFLRDNYTGSATVTPVDESETIEADGPAPSPKRLSQSAVWRRRIQREADDMEAKAVDLREKATALEDEAKKLRGAAGYLAD